ncbi:MAG TPA: hypothetical protein VIM14_09360 [Polyangia bacterium]
MNHNRNFFRNVSSSTRYTATFALLATLAGAGCDHDHSSPPEETGRAMLSLGTIPESVNCVRVTAAGEFRSTVSDFDVAPGDTLAEALTGLPVGAVVFSANAYTGACASVTKSTVPMWISDEKTVNVVQGRSSSVTLTLYKNGRAKVTVEFSDQEDGGIDARPAGTSADGGASAGG